MEAFNEMVSHFVIPSNTLDMKDPANTYLGR